MKIFYGVHLKSSALSAALDVVRHIAEPDSIRFSHITLRGPYMRTLSANQLNNLNNNRERIWIVRLDGVGAFYLSNQNTVMIKIDLLDLSDLMHKPDFLDAIPHLTLYDGKDRAFAAALLEMLYKFDFHDYTNVGKLQKLSAKAPVGGDFSLLYKEFYQAYRQYIGENYSESFVKSLKNSEKIEYIYKILRHNFSEIFDKLYIRKVKNDSRKNLSFEFYKDNDE